MIEKSLPKEDHESLWENIKLAEKNNCIMTATVKEGTPGIESVGLIKDYSFILVSTREEIDKRLNDIYADAVANLSMIQHNAIDDIFKYVNYYYDDKNESCYKCYGGYIDCVKFHSSERGNKNFLPAILHEAKKYITDNNLTLEEYFLWADTPEENKDWIREIDKKIREEK